MFGCDLHVRPIRRVVEREFLFVCPDIHCYVATLRPRQSSHGMDYYKGCSAVPSYRLGSWFAMLYRCALPLIKKYNLLTPADFASPTLLGLGSGKDFKGSVSENLRSVRGQ